MKEADLKFAVSEFLEYLQNQGKLVYLRLNSGDFIEVRGETRRRIRGCQKGTSDFGVIMNGRVLFLELKSDKGRWAPEQRSFKILVESQSAEYHLVKSVEELEAVLG